MNKNRIAVLLTCHNRRVKTIACLDALYKQQGLNIEYQIKVFLVDDGSNDGTSEAVRENFPQLKIINGNGNLYWNRGMHLAWSEAAKEDFDLYLWLNDDTVLFPSCLSDMVRAATETNKKSIISGTTCSSIKKIATYGGRSKTKGLIEPNGNLQECDFFNGNCVLVPQSVYKIIGNLDYGFTHTIGDLDYGLRAGKAGIRSFVCYSYIGTCEKHESLSKWCSPSVKLKDRIKAFKTPLSVNPGQYFRFDYRHNGLFPAAGHFISIHLRLFFPSLWKKNI